MPIRYCAQQRQYPFWGLLCKDTATKFLTQMDVVLNGDESKCHKWKLRILFFTFILLISVHNHPPGWTNLILTSYSLVSPPLHLSLIVAEIISLLALCQVRDTAELLVVVDQLVITPNAVNGIWMKNGRKNGYDDTLIVRMSQNFFLVSTSAWNIIEKKKIR